MSLSPFSPKKMMEQCANPKGRIGRILAQGMNKGHKELTRWGLAQIEIPTNGTFLDIGCGGGAAIKTLAQEAPEGKVFGLDLSEESVAVARKTNKRKIEEGSVEILQGSVEALPFPDETFDIVTAIETHYFWPDLPANTKEVFRVLKQGGAFTIIAELYKGSPHEERDRKWLEVWSMSYLGKSDFEDLLRKAGFEEYAVTTEEKEGHICACGRKGKQNKP